MTSLRCVGRIVLVAQFDGHGFQQYTVRNHIPGGMKIFLKMGRVPQQSL